MAYSDEFAGYWQRDDNASHRTVPSNIYVYFNQCDGRHYVVYHGHGPVPAAEQHGSDGDYLTGTPPDYRDQFILSLDALGRLYFEHLSDGQWYDGHFDQP